MESIAENSLSALLPVIRQGYEAYAELRGSRDYPLLKGRVYFYQTAQSVLVVADLRGLPFGTGPCAGRIFGFHIHEGTSCKESDGEDPFPGTMGHYNPGNCPHPGHAGDLPPLFGNHGRAVAAFLTDRFKVRDIIGRTVVVHGRPDDFRTQPSGDSGTKIACGQIRHA